jgi:hypothetical protein
MSKPHELGDWPTKASPHILPLSDEAIFSAQLEKELRLTRKKRMPTFLSLGIGAALAVVAYVIFANQQGSFTGAGSKIDSDISSVKASSVAAGQRAAAATGDAARNAGANIDDAINPTTTDGTKANSSKASPPKS